MKKYSAFLKSAYEGLSAKGSPPSMVIVHPSEFDAVRESLEELGLTLLILTDTEVSPGRITIGFGAPLHEKKN